MTSQPGYVTKGYRRLFVEVGHKKIRVINNIKIYMPQLGAAGSNGLIAPHCKFMANKSNQNKMLKINRFGIWLSFKCISKINEQIKSFQNFNGFQII